MTETDTERLRALLRRLEAVVREIKAIERVTFRDDDSPKGEFVPGVRFA